MDQPFSSSSTFSPSLLTIIFVFSIITFIISYKKSKPNKKLPPGPWKLPIVGNIHQLISSSCPHHQLADMAKKYGPMMHLQLGQVPHLIVSSPEAAMEVMKIHDIEFAGRPSSFAASTITYNYKDIAFGAYGDYWRWLRKICVVDLLSTKRVQSFRCMRDEEVSSMVESIRIVSGNMVVDIKEVMFALTSGITARASFGRSSKERNAAYVPMVKKIVEAFGGFTIADFFPSIWFLPAITGLKSEISKLYKELDGVFQSITDEHRANRGKTGVAKDGEPENLLDFLLDLQENGGDRLEFPLTTEHIKGIIFDMFTGGIETSSTTVEWVMSELMINPKIMKKVQTEIRDAFQDKNKVDETKLHTLKYFDAVLKEALRDFDTLVILPQEVRKDVKVNGYEIPAGTIVLVNAWAIGRDSKYWTEPERFRPNRFVENDLHYKGTNFQFIPFGSGRRMCVGMGFGVINVELALANMLYHFDWELPNGMEAGSLDMSESFGITTGRRVPLHLKPVPWKKGSLEMSK